MEAKKFIPEFTDREDLNNSEVLKNGVLGIVKKDEPIPHDKILEQLLEQFERIDFKSIVFPKAEKLKAELKQLGKESEEAEELKAKINKMKVSTKHYLVLAIEQILKVAQKKRWGLCKNHDFIYLYNGAYWAEIDKEAFQKFLGEAAERIGVEKYSSKHYQFREQLFKQFLALAYLPKPETDKDKVLINLQNGTFEISPQHTKLRPFDASDFLTYQLPFKYDPKAKAPTFQKYLDRVLPDKASQDVLAEFLGFVFIKHGSNALKEEKALILYGTGANGKSVFFEIVSALLGDENTSNYSLQSLTNESGYYRAKIANKLVNYASEINSKLEAAIFKQLVSGEPVEARLPYGEPFTLKQYAKLIFNCNELPRDVEHTNAYFRRFLIVPFSVTIPPEEQDKQLHTKIIENELSGVFNWVLAGLHRLLKQKMFTDSQAIKEAIEQYKNQSNSVKLFLDENGYQKSATAYELIKKLYPKYRDFCLDDGFKPVNKSNFINRLKGCGVETQRKNIGNVAYLSDGLNSL